jgi:hypothetical protein
MAIPESYTRILPKVTLDFLPRKFSSFHFVLPIKKLLVMTTECAVWAGWGGRHNLQARVVPDKVLVGVPAQQPRDIVIAPRPWRSPWSNVNNLIGLDKTWRWWVGLMTSYSALNSGFMASHIPRLTQARYNTNKVTTHQSSAWVAISRPLITFQSTGVGL